MSNKLATFLQLDVHQGSVDFDVLETFIDDQFDRHLITYTGSEQDTIPAYLFVPKGQGPFPGILIHHQHNGERHLGKSEVAGLAGDKWQAFGPRLAAAGFVVLAPDSICFEDRRKNKTGTEPDSVTEDWLQHFNEMSYRLVHGTTLMKKVLDDATVGVSLLCSQGYVDCTRVGLLGHSYGGNTAFFQTAIDARIRYACYSGAVCSYRHKIETQTGLEFALVIPDIMKQFDFSEILQCNPNAQHLVAYAEDDKYSADAQEVIGNAGLPANVFAKRFVGGHALNEERFGFIVDWIKARDGA